MKGFLILLSLLILVNHANTFHSSREARLFKNHDVEVRTRNHKLGGALNSSTPPLNESDRSNFIRWVDNVFNTCPNKCSGNGACLFWSVCVCNKPYYGKDCFKVKA